VTISIFPIFIFAKNALHGTETGDYGRFDGSRGLQKGFLCAGHSRGDQEYGKRLARLF
jgi:hypothetical protein